MQFVELFTDDCPKNIRQKSIERNFKMITILIANDSEAARTGLRHLLEAEPDFKVVGEAASGTQALELLDQLHPDIMVLDLVMPDMNGLEILKRIQARRLITRAIVLSVHSDQEHMLIAQQHGAMGFIVKDYVMTELANAVRDALKRAP
jgi:two-component system, NarL family, response regulator NreC